MLFATTLVTIVIMLSVTPLVTDVVCCHLRPLEDP